MPVTPAAWWKLHGPPLDGNVRTSALGAHLWLCVNVLLQGAASLSGTTKPNAARSATKSSGIGAQIRSVVPASIGWLCMQNTSHDAPDLGAGESRRLEHR